MFHKIGRQRSERHALRTRLMSSEWRPLTFLIFRSKQGSILAEKKTNAKQPVLISKTLWMNFGQTDTSGTTEKHPNKLWLKCSYDLDEPWSKVSLFKGRQKTPPSLSVSLPTKYEHGHPIKEAKLDDLASMVPFLPLEHRQFYTDLIANAPRAGQATDCDAN